MKGRALIDSFGEIDEKYLEEMLGRREARQKKSRERRQKGRVIMLRAGVAAVTAATVIMSAVGIGRIHLGTGPAEPGVTPIKEELSTEIETDAGTSGEELLEEVAVGDVIEFGRYEQDGDKSNGPEAIEWRVLAADDGKVLVISKYVLEGMRYYPERVDITWEECTLRKWLNDDFYQAAFSEEEQDCIVLTQVINEDNPDRNTEGGNDTEDKIFLLSIAEAREYFADDEDRKVHATKYADDNGAFETTASWWWLRTHGLMYSAAYVYIDGRVMTDGIGVISEDGGVRPAMIINPALMEK